MKDIVDRLITHSGAFHADDVLAYILLSKLHPDARLVRTRDDAVLEMAGERDIVFDVGFVYDPARRRYDHHQPGRPLRPDGNPYSSVGLVWHFHGEEYLRALLPRDGHDVVGEVWERMDETVFVPVDRWDNGVVEEGDTMAASHVSISALVEDFHPNWDDVDTDYDNRFQDAADAFRRILNSKIAKFAASARARPSVVEAFLRAEDPRVVVIPEFAPVGSVISDHAFSEVLFLVERSRSSGDWYVNCVRPAGEPFGQRKPLPAEWAGLRGEALCRVTGIPDAVFCHLARFTCAARSLDSALRLASLALAYEPESAPERRP